VGELEDLNQTNRRIEEIYYTQVIHRQTELKKSRKKVEDIGILIAYIIQSRKI
jgi:hypothetical protein